MWGTCRVQGHATYIFLPHVATESLITFPKQRIILIWSGLVDSGQCWQLATLARWNPRPPAEHAGSILLCDLYDPVQRLEKCDMEAQLSLRVQSRRLTLSSCHYNHYKYPKNPEPWTTTSLRYPASSERLIICSHLSYGGRPAANFHAFHVWHPWLTSQPTRKVDIFGSLLGGPFDLVSLLSIP